MQKCDDENELHVHQPRGCATSGSKEVDWGWMQGMRILSVAESEFYAGVKGGSILLGAQKHDD